MRSPLFLLMAFGALGACGGGGGGGSGSSPCTAALPCPGGPGGPAPSPGSASQAAAGAVVQVVAGDYHSCARMGDGTVRCWGRNAEGQLGDGTTDMRTKPVLVAGIAGAKSIGVGGHVSCALLGDGSVQCWGSGKAWNDGQAHTNQPPTAVQGIAGVTQLDGGGELVCARLSTGAATCWGDATKIVGAPPGANVVEVSVEEAHACARTADGAAHCWGDDDWTKTFGDPGVTGATDLGTGDMFACVVVGGGVSCWGRNEQGELGTGTPDFDDHPKAAPIAGIAHARDVEAGEAHGCVILLDQSVVCWGSNNDGELGRGQATADPQVAAAVPGLAGIVGVALGNDHVCALAQSGAVSCWGSNKMGQLGDGTTDGHASPAVVSF